MLACTALTILQIPPHLTEKLAEAGLQRIMLQWLDLDNIEGIESMGKEILPQLKR
ncbi:MAG: hypothetical protein N2D54_05800 [Chloroflexota bacterium]